MIVLTAKLNERDQSVCLFVLLSRFSPPIIVINFKFQIISQKEEAEGLKKHIGSLEDSLDQKTAQIFHLQRLTAEHEV